MVVLEGVELHDRVSSLAKQTRPLLGEDGFAAAPRAVEHDDGMARKVANDVGEALARTLGFEDVRLGEPVPGPDLRRWRCQG